MKFRIPRYLWIAGALALSLAGLAAMSGDVWGRTDQRSGGGGAPSAQNRPGDQRPGGRRIESVLPPEGWEWWKDPEFKKEVNLTDAQSVKIDQIFRERRHAYLPFRAEFEKQYAETNRLAIDRVVSVEEFALQVSRMQALWSKVQESRFVMLYQMSKELTPEQYKKFQEYRERRAQSRGRGGQR